MCRTLLLSLSAAFALSAFAQNKTKEGYSLSWDRTITTGTDSIAYGSIQVPATTVPVYEARPSDLSGLLKTALPMATFKEAGEVMTANTVTLPNITGPVDLVATTKEDKKGGFTTLAFGMMQNGVPLAVDQSTQQNVVRDLGVKLNKAVVQKQLDTWQGKLEKAGKQQAGAEADKDKANAKVSKANAELEKTVAKRSSLQREIANNQADIARQDVRWQTSQNPKDLKKLTKLREQLAKNEKKLADTMADETKQTKTANKRQDELPGAMKDHDKVAEGKAEVQRTVDALKAKLDNIR